MQVDLEQIKDNYSKMSDAELEIIAKFKIALLQTEVKPIVIAEIKKRGLDNNLLTGIEAQTKELSETELLELMNKIKGLSCPICGESNKGLVGGIIRKVRSYVILTQYEKRPIIACQSCMDKERKNQLIKNCLLGWWGIPGGMFYRTPQAILGHFLDNRRKEELSELILAETAIQGIGELRTNWDNEEKLVEYIHRQNRNLILSSPDI